MATTIQDIASRLKISHVAVSNALRGTGRIGAETRKRVLKTAAEMGYRPNSYAQAIRSGRMGAVALLLGTVAGSSTLPEGLLCGIHDALAEENLHLVITRLPDEKLTREGVVPKTLRETMVDGLLVNYTDHIPRKMKQLIGRQTYPVIWINVRDETDCVHPDDRGAGRDATRWLLQKGHRRIAYADYSHDPADPEVHYSAVDRRQGYVDAMAEAGLPPQVVFFRAPDAEEHIRSWLTAADRPTSVVTYGDIDAQAITFVARLIGLRVPEDFAVVGFSDRPIIIARKTYPTWQVPQYELGLEASRMLSRKIADPELTIASRAVPFNKLV